jgi:hypothetical protein
MPCGACGPTSDIGEMNMYKELEKKVLADEEERKQKERERRVSLGLAPEGEVYLFLQRLRSGVIMRGCMLVICHRSSILHVVVRSS